MATTPIEEAKLSGGAVLPAGSGTVASQVFAQTFDRRLAISTAYAPTSGRLEMTGILLGQGQVVTGVTFVSGAQAEATGTNLWFALYRQDLVLMAQSTNDTGAAAFAANTALRKALTAPQTCPYTGLYYLGFMCTATTMPTLLNLTSGLANNLGSIAGMTPIVSGTSSTGLTTSAPNPAAALTTMTQSLYAFVD